VTASHFHHQTVLLRETVGLLEPKEGRLIVDGTLGGGGHSEALLDAGATVVGLDRDPRALAAASHRLARFGARFRAVQGDYGSVRRLVPGRVDGLLLDLGVSSPQLDDPARGFSFQLDGPLDMRMGDFGETAAELVERLSEADLADVIYEFGEEHASRAIARTLKARRPKTTAEAVDAVKAAVPRQRWPKGTHVATRTFQALRIAVNRELEQLDEVLGGLPALLEVGGVAAIISFHSLEDRRVKHGFRRLCGERDDLPKALPVMPTQSADFEALGRRAITAQEDELRANPRARSARLRAIRRTRCTPDSSPVVRGEGVTT
jgi:16S rRNA (cytosine1402-N4)-methyltransferase